MVLRMGREGVKLWWDALPTPTRSVWRRGVGDEG